MDILRSLIEGVICGSYLLTFLIQQNVALIDRRPPPVDVTDLSRRFDGGMAFGPGQPFPPLPPAPPPAPPSDNSGYTGWVILIAFCWTNASLALKVLRYIVHLEADRG